MLLGENIVVFDTFFVMQMREWRVLGGLTDPS